MKQRNFIWIMIIIFIVLVTACQSEIIDTEIYEHLEITVETEDSLQEIREEMAELEEEESELYKRLIDEPFNNNELISEYIDQANELITNRQQLLKDEYDTMQLSRERFVQIEPLIEQIEKDSAKDSAKNMYEIMIKRYDIYQEWYETYLRRLEEETVLYTFFREDKIDFDKVNEQVETVNETYDEAKIILDNFSEQTTLYNQAKIDYYKKSDLNINFE